MSVRWVREACSPVPATRLSRPSLYAGAERTYWGAARPGRRRCLSQIERRGAGFGLTRRRSTAIHRRASVGLTIYSAITYLTFDPPSASRADASCLRIESRSRRPDAFPATEGAFPATEEARPASEEARSATEEACSATEEACPATEEACSATEEACSASEEACSASEEARSVTEQRGVQLLAPLTSGWLVRRRPSSICGGAWSSVPSDPISSPRSARARGRADRPACGARRPARHRRTRRLPREGRGPTAPALSATAGSPPAESRPWPHGHSPRPIGEGRDSAAR